MPRKSSTVANSLIQATILKKCDRANHRPGSNKQCANGTCQHTCEPAQVQDCGHKWTVRYSVNSSQREQSFARASRRGAHAQRFPAPSCLHQKIKVKIKNKGASLT